jgi:hypothetical protein
VSEEDDDTHSHENNQLPHDWEMEKLCWQIGGKKEGDGQLGYNKQKS